VPGGQLPLYDPISKTFRLIAGKTQAGQIQESVTLLGDGTVLLAGGWICPGNSTAAHEFGPDNRAQIYDPVTDTFTATENMTNGRSGCCGPACGNPALTISFPPSPLTALRILSLSNTANGQVCAIQR
jgi:hypothetical protein